MTRGATPSLFNPPAQGITAPPPRRQVLRVLAFSSDRKRMSVVLRHTQTGEIWLHCKGADEKIFGPSKSIRTKAKPRF